LRSVAALAVLALCLFGCAPIPQIKKHPAAPPCEICLRLKHQLAKPPDILQMPKIMGKFYRQRGYQPVWTSSGSVLPRVDDLLQALRNADREGLDPTEYHLVEIEKFRGDLKDFSGQKISDGARAAGFDLLLSDAYLLYASHLVGGRTDPEKAHAQWALIRKKADLSLELDKAVDAGQITSSLEALAPQHDDYADLRAQLAIYRRKRGSEKKPARQKLLEDRINKIKNSMDRWRWLPNDLGGRYLVVNIPAFWLKGYENGEETFSAPVIVGKNDKDHQTPVFSNRISYLEFCPSWNVPKDIAVKEMLGHIQEDPAYLDKNHLEVVSYINDQPTVVETKKIDWCDYTPQYFPFLLRQKPGPWNSLGGIKFMFPNEYNVYIHAHPEKNLFKRRRRMFSHGCVRVEDPTRLAQFVLNDPDWTAERINQLTKQPEPVVVDLREPLPVYLVYWTAWIDKLGKIHFEDDAYGWETVKP